VCDYSTQGWPTEQVLTKNCSYSVSARAELNSELALFSRISIVLMFQLFTWIQIGKILAKSQATSTEMLNYQSPLCCRLRLTVILTKTQLIKILHRQMKKTVNYSERKSRFWKLWKNLGFSIGFGYHNNTTLCILSIVFTVRKLLTYISSICILSENTIWLNTNRLFRPLLGAEANTK